MHPALRYTFIVYFATHIPISLVLDFQAILGAYYPPVLRALYSWYVTTFSDPLMAAPPVWLRSFILAELLLQFPFFFAATYALVNKKNWIRVPGIAYGVHVSTTGNRAHTRLRGSISPYPLRSAAHSRGDRVCKVVEQRAAGSASGLLPSLLRGPPFIRYARIPTDTLSNRCTL